MSQFWVFAFGLALLAVLFVVWPFVRRQGNSEEGDRQALVFDLFNDSRKELEAQKSSGEIGEEEYQQLMAELESSLLEDSVAESDSAHLDARWPLLVFAGVVVIGSFMFYQQRGSLDDVSIQVLLEQRFQQQMAAMRSGEVADGEVTHELIEKLQKRVEQRPEIQENRYLLARLAAEAARYGLAVQHYTVLLQSLEEPDPKMMAELAQVVFLASGSRVTQEVTLLVEKILELNPNETTALGLAGIEAFESADYQQAIRYWERAISFLPPNSPVVRGLMGGVQRAQSMLSGQLSSNNNNVVESAAAESLSVSVALGEGVQVADDAFVMVYAREWGGKMPLAISRFRAGELPKSVSLDKSMSMMPGVDITTVSQLEVVARISVSDDAMPQSGDWQESMGPVVLSDVSEGISLIVSQQLP
ncbi:MAG: c-type cytochrome biogenesis protein CcmI [Pseudomonadota bacterium]|nr:c-type cytochrome biogenesis protein CcmI [Pseudomonadota bacterium]